jgi:Kef-type K+ transport system membrane component KefB
VAIGAFFAGLVFCERRERIADQTPFLALHDLFVPFFFFSIGLKVNPEALGGAWLLGLVLLATAVLGKLLGTGLPSAPMVGLSSAATLGVSLVPRAEITMIITQRALEAGPWALSQDAYSAMVLVVLATCVLAPPTLHHLIRRYVRST